MSTEFNDVDANGKSSKVTVTRFARNQERNVQLTQRVETPGPADSFFHNVQLNEAQAKEMVARFAEVFDWEE